MKLDTVDPFKPSNFELESWERWRRTHRQMLAGMVVAPAYFVGAWLTVRYYPYVALVVFAILPVSAFVGYLVWKGWIEKPPKPSDGS